MPRPRKYPHELIERGVRLALESGRPVRHVADDLGIHYETLRRRVRQAEADGGLRPDLPTTEEREEIKRLKREVQVPARRGILDQMHRWLEGGWRRRGLRKWIALQKQPGRAR